MSTSLFDHNWRYTPAASEFSNKIEAMIRPIVAEYIQLGYSPRELAYLIDGVSADLTLSEIFLKEQTKKPS